MTKTFANYSQRFLGRERIHNVLECDEGTRRLWDERAAQAPPKVANMTYNLATEKFLREADRLESKVIVEERQS